MPKGKIASGEIADDAQFAPEDVVYQAPTADERPSISARVVDRVPSIGDAVLYTLGSASKHPGETRAAIITAVVDEALKVVRFNVQCAEPDDFPPTQSNSGLPRYPVAPNTAPYDAKGKPGTWRYAA